MFLFFSSACKKKVEPKDAGSETIEEIEDDNWADSEEYSSPVVDYEFEVSKDYSIKVQMNPDLGWIQYFANDKETIYGLVLPFHLPNDIGYANFEMEAKDVNNDGYKDLVLFNIQRSRTIERIHYFDPVQQKLTLPLAECDFKNRSLKNMQGLVTLDMDDGNFVTEDSITFVDKDNMPWLQFKAGDLQNPILPHILTLESSTQTMYANWLYMKPWLILFEVYHKLIVEVSYIL